MRPVSDSFLRAIRSSHAMRVRATVCTTFQDGVTPTGTEIQVRSASLKFSAKSAIRASLDIETDGENFVADDPDGLLAPYGNEIFIEIGIEIVGQSVEWIGLGYYRIDNSEQDDAPRGPVRIVGYDRNVGLRDGRIINRVQQFAAGTSIGDIFDDLVLEVYPSATIEFDDATDAETIARNTVVEEDRLKFLMDLAASRGKVMYWNYEGVLRIEDPPSPTVPVFAVNEGHDGVLTKIGRSLNREGIYNAVRAEGEGTDDVAPVWAIVRDNDVDSPTYYYGNFGPVPRYYSSPFITTSAQARTAAESILRKSLGLPYNIDFQSWVNPALEVNDPVAIKYHPSLLSETHVLDEISFDITNATMTAVSRLLQEEDFEVVES